MCAQEDCFHKSGHIYCAHIIMYVPITKNGKKDYELISVALSEE